uniref:uncharacterized protein LOC124068136 n=1 Tax=Scatophagus argus TaxID=75038 RepID=UPI001ED7EAD5|nr:uncharacterized protein LOC124068136 [Scatophagus argus]
MAKGKAKNNTDSLNPAQPRPLRSRKRECPRDEIPETDNIHPALHHQDTERNNTAVDATVLQCHQSPLQESAVIPTHPHEAAEQSRLTKQDAATEEKPEETTVKNPNSQPEGFSVHTVNDASQSGQENEEITVGECDRTPSQTCTDRHQVLLPTSGEGKGICATALEDQLDAKDNSQSNLERNQETIHEECSIMYVADVTKEAEVGLPAKKKRRMGMCGLTEKERSHFLQTQKRENGQNRPENAKKEICNNTTVLVAQEVITSLYDLPFSLSIPAGSVTEHSEAEMTLQSSHFGGGDRIETEVHIAVTASVGTSTLCDSDCSKQKSCEAAESIVPSPELTEDTKSGPPTEEDLLGNEDHQQCEGRTAVSVAEKPKQQMKDEGDGSAVVHPNPAISFDEETENRDANAAAPLQMTRTRYEKKEDLTYTAGDCASSTDTLSGGYSCGPVELCEAAVSPGGPERKDSCDPDDEAGAGPSTLNAEPLQTRDTTDTFGSGYLDHVSDSQLNTIALIEEEVMEREEELDSPDCQDSTDLICGLIRELSSLNQKVMATHRELENLRRSSKNSRSSRS